MTNLSSTDAAQTMDRAKQFSSYAYERSVQQETWATWLKSAVVGSAAAIILISDYGLYLPHVGTSSSVVDHRAIIPSAKQEPSPAASGFQELIARSISEQLQELQAALSLNKSQLARVLGVSRPTLYDWFQNKEPNASNAERLNALLRALARAEVTSSNPLNARFVRQPLAVDEPALLDVLSAGVIDEERVVHMFQAARQFGDAAATRRRVREDRLRALGLDEPSDAQRREQLASNIALLDWPKR